MSAWWSQKELILYNNKYEPDYNAQRDLETTRLIGIYFGSYSSRITRLFTRYLKKFHEEIRSKTHKFQIIFCSMDDNENDCREFVRECHGSWLVIPWQDQSNRRTARNQCNVSSHPRLVILKNEEDGIVISLLGKEEIEELGEGAFDKWDEMSKVALKGMGNQDSVAALA